MDEDNKIWLDDVSWIIHHSNFLPDSEAQSIFDEIRPIIPTEHSDDDELEKDEDKEGEENSVKTFLNSNGRIEWRHDFVVLSSGFVAKEPRITTFLGEQDHLVYEYSGPCLKYII